MKIGIDKIVDRSDFKATIPASFPSNSELQGNQFILADIVNLYHDETHHLY